MLKGFVTKEDYPKLLEILRKAADGKLGDVTSVLQIWGGHASGKSALIEVIRCLSDGDNVRICARTFDTNFPQSEYELLPFQKTVACCREVDLIDVAPVLTKFHRLINFREPVKYWVRYQGLKWIHYTATLVIATNAPYALTERESDRRHPMYLHLPNVFAGPARLPYDEVVQQCLVEFNELRGGCA